MVSQIIHPDSTLALVKLIRNSGFIRMAGLKLATAILSRPTEMGSRCLVHGTIIAKTDEVHGKYLNNCRVEEESDFVISDDGAQIQERVWVSEHPRCLASPYSVA